MAKKMQLFIFLNERKNADTILDIPQKLIALIFIL